MGLGGGVGRAGTRVEMDGKPVVLCGGYLACVCGGSFMPQIREWAFLAGS